MPQTVISLYIFTSPFPHPPLPPLFFTFSILQTFKMTILHDAVKNCNKELVIKLLKEDPSSIEMNHVGQSKNISIKCGIIRTHDSGSYVGLLRGHSFQSRVLKQL